MYRWSVALPLLIAVALISTQALAYELRQAPCGRALIWGSWQASVRIDDRPLEGAPGAADATRAAFATYAAHGAPVTVELSETEQAGRGEQDGVSTVTFLRDGWEHGDEVVALTLATYYVQSSLVFETDIVVDATTRRWSTGAANPHRYDVQSVLTHEIGHFFGLDHSRDAEASMAAQSSPGDTSKRVLSEDDRLGIAALIAEMQSRLGKTPPPPETHAEVQRQASTSPLPSRQAMGCQLAGGQTASWSLAWPLLLLLWSWRPRRWKVGRAAPSLGSVLVALVLLLSAPADATVVRELSVAQLAKRADTVVEGKIVARRSLRQGRFIVTDYTLVSKGYWKGRLLATRVLRVLGGEVDGIGLHVAGLRPLKVGQRILLFARERGDRLLPVGLGQGVYNLQHDGTKRDLRSLALLNPQGALRVGAIERGSKRTLSRSLRQARLRWQALPSSVPGKTSSRPNFGR